MCDCWIVRLEGEYCNRMAQAGTNWGAGRFRHFVLFCCFRSATHAEHVCYSRSRTRTILEIMQALMTSTFSTSSTFLSIYPVRIVDPSRVDTHPSPPSPFHCRPGRCERDCRLLSATELLRVWRGWNAVVALVGRVLLLDVQLLAGRLEGGQGPR